MRDVAFGAREEEFLGCDGGMFEAVMGLGETCFKTDFLKDAYRAEESWREGRMKIYITGIMKIHHKNYMSNIFLFPLEIQHEAAELQSVL